MVPRPPPPPRELLLPKMAKFAQAYMRFKAEMLENIKDPTRVVNNPMMAATVRRMREMPPEEQKQTLLEVWTFEQLAAISSNHEFVATGLDYLYNYLEDKEAGRPHVPSGPYLDDDGHICTAPPEVSERTDQASQDDQGTTGCATESPEDISADDIISNILNDRPRPGSRDAG